MGESEKQETVATVRSEPGIGRRAARWFVVLARAVIVLAVVVGVIFGIRLIPDALGSLSQGLVSQAEDAAPGITRSVLLWVATNKTLAEINSIANEWAGLLAIVAIVLSVVLYLMSRSDNSGSRK